MKKIACLSSLILSLGMLVVGCGKDDSTTPSEEGGPSITSFSPTSGPVGTQVFIRGKNFSDTVAANTVTFGNVAATITTASTIELFATVPEAASTGKVSVIVNGKTDTAGTFTVTQDEASNNVALSKTEIELFTLDSETLSFASDVDVNTNVDWSSNDVNVAIVDDNGKITGIAAGSTIITAIVGDNEVEANVHVKASVFAVGYETIDGVSIAKIWKNGVATSLPGGTDFAAATSVFVDGSDVYACGIVDNGQLPIAAVWKNGETLYELTDGSKYGNAWSIHVYDSDLYVIGNEELGDGNISNGTIWKNGVTYATLTNGLNVNETSNGEDIFVNETGIYSVGYEESELHENGTPKLWEDTALTNLTDETYHGRAYSVYAVDSDVYAAGYEENDNEIWVAKYWKNGEVTTLTDGSTNADAQSIFVVDEDVYVAGSYYEDQETLQQAVVWENGTPTNLGAAGSGAVSVYAYDNDVYVGGLEPQGEVTNAIVWKNGEPMEIELTEGAGNSLIFSVFVR